jgi:replicative DNA helicase
MSLDVTALRLLKYRERYTRLARAVPSKALQPTTASLLADIGCYFREFPEANKVEHGPFLTWYRGFRHPKMKDDEFSVYGQIITAMMTDVSDTVEAGLMERLVAADVAAKVVGLIEKWNDGAEVDLYASLRDTMERYEQDIQRKVKTPQVLDAIEDLLKAEENDEGLPWHLRCLREHIKPLRGGDFVVVAARPDKGKTTFCAHMLTYMAPFVDQMYPDEGRSILWFNNEGPGKKIVMRNFQAALGATTEELVTLANTPADPEFSKYKTMVRQKYAAALGGRPGVLRVFDIHDMWNHEVEDIMKKYKPALVLFDMVDNIKFGGDANNNGQRTDQLLEAMYQWARLMGVKHDCAVVATSQLSAPADGEPWPTLPQLKDSQTGKQGAADLILTIGTVNDASLVNSRYIGTTKNKLVRTNKRASPMVEVQFDGGRGRYKESEGVA